MTRLFVDASVKASIVRALRAQGAEVLYGLEHDPGAPDAAVLAEAARENLVLVTEDTDFGELVFRDYADAPGVVLIRRNVVSASDAEDVAAQILGMPDIGRAAFAVIDDAGIRSRPLPAKPASPPSSGN